MAYVWELCAVFDGEPAAQFFSSTFDKSEVRTSYGNFPLSVISRPWESASTELNPVWTCIVIPCESRTGMFALFASGGPDDEQSRRLMNEIGLILYGRLSQLCGFQYALAGVEVSDWLSVDELVERGIQRDLDDGHNGLVVSQQLWAKCGSPDNFVPFGRFGGLWIPWRGESFREDFEVPVKLADAHPHSWEPAPGAETMLLEQKWRDWQCTSCGSAILWPEPGPPVDRAPSCTDRIIHQVMQS